MSKGVELVVEWMRKQSHALDEMAATDTYGLQARADYKTAAINTRALARAIERGDHRKATP